MHLVATNFFNTKMVQRSHNGAEGSIGGMKLVLLFASASGCLARCGWDACMLGSQDG